MICGVGLDVLSISRMSAELSREEYGRHNCIFTPSEIDYCDSIRDSAQHFAARFAAKTAFIKALGRYSESGYSLTDIEVHRDSRGAPTLKLSGRLRELADGLGVTNCHVSLTHTREWAAAMVLLESS